MFYYEVWPAAKSYKANVPLTYKSESKLVRGKLVTISVRNEVCAGVVSKTTTKPTFPAKAILSVPDCPPLPIELVKLAVWMVGYYPSGIGPILRQFINKNLLNKSQSLNTPVDISDTKTVTLPKLTSEQASALTQIGDRGTYILHGETGSGKTRVYIELAKKALSSGRSAIVLTPEIGLTPQLAKQFEQIFGDKVIVTHSQLTPVQRRNAWQEIISNHGPQIIIGPRSALFSPLKNVGLIVIDESHDGSYKQNETPRYQTTTVAAKLAELHNCPLILGSATPSVSDYFLARERRRPILRLKKLATSTNLEPPIIELVDLKDRSQFKRGRYLSDRLIDETEAALARNEQVLLFLNRRGTARSLQCQNCGWVAICPNCDLALTYHADSHSLRCHICNYNQPAVTSCPTCSSSELSFRGAGSKAIEAEAKKLFPKASIRRFDADNPKAERLEQIYYSVKNGDVDIIIGTQTIAKGLDLPNLSVVGIVTADTSLYLPDFSSSERSYQLIRQVVGRVGRGHRKSTAIVQTYSPNNQVIKSALAGDYDGFYSRELAERQAFHYPPAVHLLKLTIKRASANKAEKDANQLKGQLQSDNPKLTIEGPSPCFHEIKNNKHYWQLIVKSSSRKDLLAALSKIPKDWTGELDPVNLL